MKPNFIAGQWLDSAASVANINPSDTRDTIDHYAQADAGMAEAAIAAAHEAKAAWGFCSPQARADALDRIGAEILARREELGRLLSRKKARRCPKASAKSRAPATSSSSTPARPCASAATSWPRSGRA